ncbi:hypothetical protein BO71DRAFT_426123 [Aspergillus ellipticus CBS 707.79]|uniref:Uncharacterized protein n=1 Tax=Aspergillus ellipticus CBS 707.79 TaxID=1448320 RepID=A0A319DLP6_9EURO|nr:hypothetical protein BO71DRAFT_426123 [Aspergillus ellipticus CBS 707.79]
MNMNRAFVFLVRVLPFAIERRFGAIGKAHAAGSGPKRLSGKTVACHIQKALSSRSSTVLHLASGRSEELAFARGMSSWAPHDMKVVHVPRGLGIVEIVWNRPLTAKNRFRRRMYHAHWLHIQADTATAVSESATQQLELTSSNLPRDGDNWEPSSSQWRSIPIGYHMQDLVREARNRI